MAKPKRFAAGRARALGIATRGTTHQNRLRRNDHWIADWPVTSNALDLDPAGLVIDLGFGATPVTTLELAARLHRRRPELQILGLEIDQERVDLGKAAERPATVDFARGGFELAGRRPVLVRAMNVLRQYDESAVVESWERIQAQLLPGGLLVEGTCDEIGRLGSWVLLDTERPLSLTLSCAVAHLPRPEEIAERLPKVLIHHNVPGRRIHELFRALGAAWDGAAGYSVFSPVQRWQQATRTLVEEGWPLLDTHSRRRHGELTVDWSAVAD